MRTSTDDGPVVVAEAVVRQPGFKIPTDDDRVQESAATPKTEASKLKASEPKQDPDQEDNTVDIRPVDYGDED